MGELQCQRTNQADDRVFCSAIGADIGIPLQPGGRRNHDDAAVRTILHRRQHGLDGMDDTHEIDVHHTPEQCGVRFYERRGLRDACVCDQNVDRLPRGGLRDRGVHRHLIGDVGDICEMRSAGGDSLIEGGMMAAEHRDRCTRPRKRGCDLAADAAAAAGDQRMWGTRQSGHALGSPSEFFGVAACIYFRLQAFARNQASTCLTDQASRVASN